MQNVSAGIRAFCVGGSKARFDGVDPVTGEKRWRAVSETQNSVHQNWDSAPRSAKGTSLEFQLSPTITALLPTASKLESSAIGITAEEMTLNTSGLLHTLSSDFARALRDLALTTHDLNKLSTFGDLPISLHHAPAGPVLRVRFPGCDADAVSALCDEVNIRRGVIIEDEAWTESRDAEMALLFPFAPTGAKTASAEDDVSAFFRQVPMTPQREHLDWRDMPLTPSDDQSTFHYHSELEFVTPSSPASPEGYESLSENYYDGSSPLPSPHSPLQLPERRGGVSVSSKAPTAVAAAATGEHYEGIEGIYRFLQEIEDARM